MSEQMEVCVFGVTETLQTRQPKKEEHDDQNIHNLHMHVRNNKPRL